MGGGAVVPIGMTGHGLSDLREVRGVGPGGDGKQGVGQSTEAIGISDAPGGT